MKVRVVTDGTPRGTRVYDTKGRLVNGVMRVELDVGMLEQSCRITIHPRFAELYADIDAEIVKG